MSESQSGSEGPAAQEPNRYRVLLKVSDLVAAAKNLPEAFQQFAPLLLDLTGGELLNLSLHDPHRNCMSIQYWKKNRDSGELEALPVDGAANGWAWRHQERIAIPDTASEQRFPDCIPVLLNLGVRSYTVLPMSTPSAHLGAVGLGKSLPNETLSGDDTELLSHIALLGALTLEKEKTRLAFEEQKILLEISRQTSLDLGLEKLLSAILASLRSIARFERAVLSLLDDDGKTVSLYGGGPEWEPIVSHGIAIPVEQDLSGLAIQTRSVTFFSADNLCAMKTPLAKAMYALGIQSVCNVPLIGSNRIWGALSVSSVAVKAFGPHETDFLQQIAVHVAAALQNAHAYQEIAQLKDRLVLENRYLEAEVRSTEPSDDIVGTSPALKHVLDYAAIVADTNSTVLLTGETGTGKERIARLIHGMSRRKDRNFIKLNCAAIPTGLLESELFGHEKGAFTGAVSQKFGRLELAHQGTLLLDEIGEIPLELQPKLLRVLQDQEFERLGGTKTIRVDVRLIAATNRDLLHAVEEKEFRSDLFYRVNVFPLHLPALRDRREDIPALIRYFVGKCAMRLHKRIDVIPGVAVDAMMKWRWPGNIRELENFIERSVILSEGSTLHAPLGELREEEPRQPPESDLSLRDKEREHIIGILRQTRGTLSGPSGAASRLGLKRTTLQYKMQRLGISRTDFLG